MRLQIDLTKNRAAALDTLMKRGDISTKKELFNYAINLLEWAVKEAEKGNIIASVNEKDGRYTELQMPVFTAAAENARDVERPEAIRTLAPAEN